METFDGMKPFYSWPGSNTSSSLFHVIRSMMIMYDDVIGHQSSFS